MVETYNQIISDTNSVKTLNDNNFVLNEFINLIFEECNPSGIKYALSKLNLCSSKVRLPLSEISGNLKSKIEKFVKEHPPC
jgi:dihydrodipicolinate synthase/N-acetylneuraminate lyase